MELLFNKIWHRCGWNNNLDVLEFKYALHTILLCNSIEPSETGNCIPFSEVFQSSLIDFKREPKEVSSSIIEETDADIMEAKKMEIHLNEETPNILLDNLLCYIAGFIIKHLMKILPCTNCHEEMLLKAHDHCRYNSTSITSDHLFLLHKQWGGLIFPSTAILKVIKMSEVIFKRRVIKNEKGITSERNLNPKIQSSILAQIGTDILNNIGGHYADHTTGEGYHLTSLLRLIVVKCLSQA